MLRQSPPPILWLSGACLLGLPVGFALGLPGWAWLAAGGTLLLATILARARLPAVQRAAFLLVVLAAACAGAASAGFALAAEQRGSLSGYTGRTMILTGWVCEPPWPSVSGGTAPAYLQVEQIAPAENPAAATAVSTRVLLRLPAGAYQYGDRLRVEGRLDRLPEGNSGSYREYLNRRGVQAQVARPQQMKSQPGLAGSRLLRWLYGRRQELYAVANRIFPQPEAALLNGILLGLDGDLPGVLADAYKNTGTAHIIAISGFNISILAALFFRGFSRLFSRWGALAGAILTTFLYALLVGAEPPVMRAAVMGAMFLTGREIGRKSGGVAALGFTAALLCLADPHLPWDASFQLTFMATLGLMLYAEPLSAGFRRLLEKKLAPETAKRVAEPVGEYLLVTLAAQITTLPVMAAHFQRLSTVALLANPLVLPPQPAVMVLSGIAVLAGRIWLPLGGALAALVWPLAAYTNRIVMLLAGVPGAALDLTGFGAGFAAMYYAALFCLPAAIKNRARLWALRARIAPAVGLVGLALLAGLVWAQAAARPDGRLHLTALRRDGQVSYLVQFPGGSQALIGSPAQSDLDRLRGFAARRVDMILLAQALTQAQSGALLALAQTHGRPVVAAPDAAWEEPAVHRMEMDLIELGGRSAGLEPGQSWVDGAARLEVLAVEKDRAAFLLTCGRLRVLLPGGIPAEGLRAALARAGGAWLVLIEDEATAAPWAKSGIPQQMILSEEGERRDLVSDGAQLWVQRGKID